MHDDTQTGSAAAEREPARNGSHIRQHAGRWCYSYHMKHQMKHQSQSRRLHDGIDRDVLCKIEVADRSAYCLTDRTRAVHPPPRAPRRCCCCYLLLTGPADPMTCFWNFYKICLMLSAVIFVDIPTCHASSWKSNSIPHCARLQLTREGHLQTTTSSSSSSNSSSSKTAAGRE